MLSIVLLYPKPKPSLIGFEYITKNTFIILLDGVNFGKLVTPDKAYKNIGGVSYLSDPGVYSLTNVTFKNRTLVGICKLFLVLNKYKY